MAQLAEKQSNQSANDQLPETLTDTLQIQFDGLHPSEATRAHIESILREMQLEAPNGAIVHATFTQYDGLCKGRVKVDSWAGPFFVTEKGANLDELAHQLLRQMRRRFEKWRTKRSPREAREAKFSAGLYAAE